MVVAEVFFVAVVDSIGGEYGVEAVAFDVVPFAVVDTSVVVSFAIVELVISLVVELDTFSVVVGGWTVIISQFTKYAQLQTLIVASKYRYVGQAIKYAMPEWHT